ncbi:LysR family transcriptional regulator [Roseibacterium sp. SDUM158016]|jgi:DNA-binding transcriptional LysR family regulator|uniref:LysR family transcriptional regulator n=1 Tax=Roseicyclus sediminis TaxID=2980997 RepID=UPI0021D07655|nr:LysR family transcriptional regulator [Roseibacterium sp. SDUM158016]MCU4652600.1 LysR family transcriptional regulator [Roseibacterium sp. SDUM158016]
MPRNLDLTAIRAFVAVVDAGGVTKASGFLNLTQSAVSMQLKRLEEMLGVSLFDRSTRRLLLTGAGEQMLGYARRMLDLNDEVLGRLTAPDYTGQITLGVPHDIVYPAIPQVLQRFATDFPRMRVQLVSSYTSRLKELFDRGEIDVILTTEDDVDHGGETLIERGLVWVGAENGQVWKQRPLRLAFEHACIFRRGVQDALDRAAISWEMAVESDSIRTVEASVSADLAVHSCIEGTEPPYVERIAHNGALPDLPRVKVNLYRAELARGTPIDALTDAIRHAFRNM